MKIKLAIITILFVFSGIFYYQITGNSTKEMQLVKVTRIIDGDTFETESGQKIRMIGINTPESKMFLHFESEKFVKELIENKTVQIQNQGVDKYGRTLAHVFLNNLHINEELLKNGYASLYYYEKDSYYKKLSNAEEFARLNKINIWEDSADKNCFSLIELKFKEEIKRCSNKEIVKIKNICDKDILITIKDDATHIYNEKIKSNSIFVKNFSCIWNDEGDSLYAWDDKGMVLFYRY
ncbi:MAG: thermonuclease family protein [Candidatus Pacearchaeota archaeon]